MPTMNKKSQRQAYDIIGDIHGHATELETLLKRLGYREEAGRFRHPGGRKVVFLGDYIDRGPEIRRVLQIVRGMIDAGEARGILGNHEVNALRYHRKGPDGEWLRPHGETKIAQHRPTLDQIADPCPAEWREYLNWFAGLPLWLEIDGFRVIHAAWFDDDVGRLRGHGPLTGDELLRLSQPKASGKQRQLTVFSTAWS